MVLPMTQEELARVIRGKTLLVTGAGGTIGSEIACQASEFQPEQIICLGPREDMLRRVQYDLRRLSPGTKAVVEVGDICDKRRLAQIFMAHHPQLVFHTAAQKHIALIESDPAQAILVNVGGTLNVVQLAAEVNAEHFVFTSSIKAEDPVSIMAATKRIGEMMVSKASERMGGCFITLRLNNVLESSGGVHETFRKQIATGGPVTITHPDIRRSFISSSEAVRLLLNTLLMRHERGLFSLSARHPVKIADIAKDLISSCGLLLGEDINITYVGLRPGEKLIEENIDDGPSWSPTAHDQIVSSSSPAVYDPEDKLDASIQELITLCEQSDPCPAIEHLRQMIHDFDYSP